MKKIFFSDRGTHIITENLVAKNFKLFLFKLLEQFYRKTYFFHHFTLENLKIGYVCYS